MAESQKASYPHSPYIDAVSSTERWELSKESEIFTTKKPRMQSSSDEVLATTQKTNKFSEDERKTAMPKRSEGLELQSRAFHVDQDTERKSFTEELQIITAKEQHLSDETWATTQKTHKFSKDESKTAFLMSSESLKPQSRVFHVDQDKEEKPFTELKVTAVRDPSLSDETLATTQKTHKFSKDVCKTVYPKSAKLTRSHETLKPQAGVFNVDQDKEEKSFAELQAITAKIRLKYNSSDVSTEPKQRVSDTSLDKVKQTLIDKESHIAGQKEKSEYVQDLENLVGIYRRSIQEAEILGFGKETEIKALSDKLKMSEELLQLQYKEERLKRLKQKVLKEEVKLPKSQSEPFLPYAVADDVVKEIDKTLSKVKQIESDEYLKDEKLCNYLDEKVDVLRKKLKELSEDFNLKDVHTKFSEYSSLTLSKLEALAKQSQNSVIAAEAQIAAHRNNSKHLSQKLKDTEELLRESINECLSLKQRLKGEEVKREIERAEFTSQIQETIDKVSDFDELETAVKEVVSSVAFSKDAKRPLGPYECLYCRQGPGHKACEEKIRDMRSDNRKLTTELKLLRKELKEEKISFNIYRQQNEKTFSEICSERKILKEAVQALESKNGAISEQLKLERKRLKNMERYRRLEIEGFQTDIKHLKAKIQDMEKQLMKAVLIFENNNKDLELLKSIHETAQHSKHAVAAIRRLKAKLYELENDIKYL